MEEQPASMQELARSAQDLSNVAADMQQVVANFKLDSGNSVHSEEEGSETEKKYRTNLFLCCTKLFQR